MPGKHTPISKLAMSVAAALTLSITPALAQEGFGDMQGQVLKHLRAGDWKQALAETTETTESLGGRAQQLFGSKFGWFYYYKGYSELKLKMYDEAMNSFKTCYEQYPTDNSAKAGNSKEGGTNIKHTESLLRWGEAAKGAGNHDLAVEKFLQFLKERQRDDKFNQGSFYVNLATSYLNKTEPDVDEGVKALQTAVTNKLTYRIPDGLLMQGIRALVAHSIKTENEQVLVDFLEQNRADLTFDPSTAQQFSPIFLREAAEASNRNLYRTAFALYSFVPSIESAMDDVKAKLASFDPAPQIRAEGVRLDRGRLNQQLEYLEGQASSPDNYESIGLRAMAVIHEQMGNVQSAYAAYKILNEKFARNKNREGDLYNLVRTTSALGKIGETETYGTAFLNEFPSSDQVGTVERLLLTSLFYSGDYQRVIEIATKVLPTIEPDTERHDNTLHVLGGSYYYEGRYYEAESYLNDHVSAYGKESKNGMAARFLQASNASRIGDNARAGSLLNAFVTEFPDATANPYLPFALFDQASVYYQTERYDEALEILERIEKEFPSASIVEMAVNLKGNTLLALEKEEEAEAAYKSALEIAERRNNVPAAGDALGYLVGLLAGKDGRAEEAIGYYELFWEKYSTDSPLRPQVAVQGLPAMREAGRTDEGLEKLRLVISDMAQTANADILEKAINSYTDAYLETHSVEELKDHYYNFPGIGSEDRATLALLRIAIIGVYEDELAAAKDDADKARTAQASIKVLFDELKSSFQPSTLSNFILVRLGDYLRTKTNSPREGIAYYREAVGRDDKSFYNEALFGLADLLGNSSEAGERTEAVQYLTKLADDEDVAKSDRERALYRIVQIYDAAEDYPAVVKSGLAYLNAKSKDGTKDLNYTKFSPQVGLLYANAFLQQGKSEEAISAFTKVYVANIGNISISAPAVKNLAELTWERNRGASGDKPSDRQVAYNLVADYISKTERLTERMSEEELAQWNEAKALAERYEASGEIKTLAEQAEEQDS